MKKKLIAILCAVAMLIPMAVMPANAALADNFVSYSQPTDIDYSFVVLGDMQSMTYYDNEDGTQYVKSVFDWILNNKETRNIEYVFGLGDTIDTLTTYSTNVAQDNGKSRNVNEWIVASTQIHRLDGVIPYTVIRGNHDDEGGYHTYICTEDYTNQMNGFYYDESKPATLGNSMSNSFRKIEIGGVKYLMLSLDYHADDAVIAWANNVVASNPDYRVVASVHAYLDGSGNSLVGFLGGTVGSSNVDNTELVYRDFSGQYFWDNLFSKHENMFMVLCGHDAITNPVHNVRTGDNGNQVIELLVDTSKYDVQFDSKYDATFAMVVNFREDTNEIQLEYLSPSRIAAGNTLDHLSGEQIHLTYENFTDTDWESVTRDNGFQIYVGDQMNKTPPTVNGVINELEYSYSKTYSSEELISPNEEKALGGVTEYIAHDADYIYYAIAVTQASDDYALQWQFNPLNQFAIFTDRAGDATPDLKASLFQRVNLKIQYKPDGQTTHELAWNYAGMTWEDLPEVGEGKDIEYAVTKTEDNLKIYEIKLSKDYLAAYNLCDKEDIKVLPYMTHQHAESTIGRNLDSSLYSTLTAAGATRPKASDMTTVNNGTPVALPLFMVLAESPDAIQNVIKPNTQETASARISTENTGLRFKTQISKAELQELIDKFGAENVSVGTLIAPQDKLGTSALTHEFGTVNQDYIDVKANINTPFADEDGVLTYAGSISNIKQKNLDREFTAVGYISYVDFNGDTKYIYSTSDATRSIDYVATKALEDTTKDYSLEARAILEKLTVKYYEDLVKDPFEEDPFYVAEN